MRSPTDQPTALVAGSTPHVLAVDLDGTLLKTDVLWESVMAYLRPAPLRVFQLVAWLLKGGRPALKARLAERVDLSSASLPWNLAVFEFCEARAGEPGTEVILATASNIEAARTLTRPFQFIHGVLGSDEKENLKASRKAAKLVASYGEGGFDYIGDSRADIEVWKVARRAYFVGSESRRFQLEGIAEKPLITIADGSEFSLRSLLTAVRPHQWLKNALVFFPLLTAHRWADVSSWQQIVPVFFALCAMASASYIINDLFDLEADRRHSRKKSRPFASGVLPISSGVVCAFLLFVAGLGLSAMSGIAAFLATFGYFVFSVLYSLRLKSIPVVDVAFLSGLYTYRMILGGVAGSVLISPWLLAFSTTFFLGLALLKRYVELNALPATSDAFGEAAGDQSVPGRGYSKSDTNFVLATGVAASFLSVVVLALYLDSSASRALYAAPHWLWGIALVLLFWLIRVWFLAGRKQMDDDPVWFAARDRFTFALAIVCVATIAAAKPL